MTKRLERLPNLAFPSASEGRKNDSGKLRMDLIPPEAVEALAAVLTMGAAKYNDRNWENGFAWGRSCAALQRHFWAWMRGEDKDPESGLSHMAHVLCNAAFLVTFEARKVGTDDRPKRLHPMMAMQDGGPHPASRGDDMQSPSCPDELEVMG